MRSSSEIGHQRLRWSLCFAAVPGNIALSSQTGGRGGLLDFLGSTVLWLAPAVIIARGLVRAVARRVALRIMESNITHAQRTWTNE